MLVTQALGPYQINNGRQPIPIVFESENERDILEDWTNWTIRSDIFKWTVIDSVHPTSTDHPANQRNLPVQNASTFKSLPNWQRSGAGSFIHFMNFLLNHYLNNRGRLLLYPNIFSIGTTDIHAKMRNKRPKKLRYNLNCVIKWTKLSTAHIWTWKALIWLLYIISVKINPVFADIYQIPANF